MKSDDKPCLECEERHINCHSDCKAYERYTEILELRRKKRLEDAESRNVSTYAKTTCRLENERYLQRKQNSGRKM